MDVRKRDNCYIRTSSVSHQKSKYGKKINQYQVLRTLGKGAYATVKLAVDINTKHKFAIKVMSKSFLKRKEHGKCRSAYDCVIGELKVLQTLQHPNIIWSHEIIDDPNKDELYIVSEYYSKGSLLNSLLEHQAQNNGKGGLPTKQLRLYFIDMLKSLYYCHNIVKVIHRDIKPDNIMLNHN